METMKIDRVEVWVVGPEIQRYTWSHDIPEQYMTNTLVRIDTDEGLQGVGAISNYTSYDYDHYTAETLRHLIPILIGQDPLNREIILQKLWPRVFPTAPAALAAIDIALWDLFGKVCQQPIYKILGGARKSILSYASTPMFPDVPTYLQFVQECIEQGFKAIKFHCWCLPEKDLELARAVRKEYPGDSVKFMLDVENNYTRSDGLRVARELSDLGFEWFEAPLFDYDLEGYREITQSVNIPILPSGNWFQDLQTFKHALTSGAWSSARTDVTVMGGFTQAKKALALVESMRMRCEVMCWGFTLVSAANLHLTLSQNLSTYFEQAVPYASYEFGMAQVIRTRSDGTVQAPEGPGLGLEIDWKAMEKATIHTISTAS